MTTKKNWSLDEQAAADPDAVGPRGDATPLLVPTPMASPKPGEPGGEPRPGPHAIAPIRPGGPVLMGNPKGSVYTRPPPPLPDEPAPESGAVDYREGPAHTRHRDEGPVLMGNPKGSMYTDERPARSVPLLRLLAIGVPVLLVVAALIFFWLHRR